MSKTYASSRKASRSSSGITTDGKFIVFDEALPQEGDPVEIICQWAFANLTPEQLEQLCDGLSLRERSATLARGNAPVMDDGYERRGPGVGPGGAGPWPTGKKASAGAIAASTFDSIFKPDDRAAESEPSTDIFGRPVGESAPRFDHVTKPILWVNLR